MEIIITMRAGIKREVTKEKWCPHIQISQACQKKFPHFTFFAITFVTCTSTS